MPENNKNPEAGSQLTRRIKQRRVTLALVFIALIIGMFTLSFLIAYNKLTADKNNPNTPNSANNSSADSSELAEENRKLRETVAALTAQTEELQAKINALSKTSSNENPTRPSASPSVTPKPRETATPKPSANPSVTPKPKPTATSSATPKPSPITSPITTPGSTSIPVQTPASSILPLPNNSNTNKLPGLPPTNE